MTILFSDRRPKVVTPITSEYSVTRSPRILMRRAPVATPLTPDVICGPAGGSLGVFDAQLGRAGMAANGDGGAGGGTDSAERFQKFSPDSSSGLKSKGC